MEKVQPALLALGCSKASVLGMFGIKMYLEDQIIFSLISNKL